MTNDKKSFWDDAWKKVAFFAALIASLFGILLFIYQSVNIITNNDRFLSNLASKINPYMIIDENNSYLYDGGAYKYIDDIIIEKDKILGNEKVSAPSKITIITNKVLPFPPQLKCIDPGDNYTISLERGEKTSWIYKLSLDEYTERRVNKFKIEIIP